MKKVTSSFVAGAVALVFAVVGYQTALVVQYSAASRIIANRDHPDTVFVERVPEIDAGGGYGCGRLRGDGRPRGDGESRGNGGNGGYGGGSSSGSASGLGSGSRSGNATPTRKNSTHSPAAQQIRQRTPPRTVQEFPFDPNTASLEELILLGFSPKQAESIENYRAKGGRFRRKEDFAKSYVVSEETYARLEPYIDIPRLDINAADSAAFDALPGIGPYFAARMVKYRKELHGYSYPEQLMDIRNFDREKFDALSDLITVGPAPAYPLWSLPADSLRLHPYIKNVNTARSIVFFREHNNPASWSIEALQKAGILKVDAAEKLGRCRID